MTAKKNKTNTTSIKPDANGRYHSPYSPYSTTLVNKMQAHLLKKHGEAWEKHREKQSDVLVAPHKPQKEAQAETAVSDEPASVAKEHQS